MDTVTVKTCELIGDALDYAVAKCEGEDYTAASGVNGIGIEYEATNYSANWSQGGPIIEREIESLYEHKPLECWAAKSKQGDLRYGPTPLIAAMRCYVASKLGDTVQIPTELVP